MNIRDIAYKSGVSTATISRAINKETRSKLAPKTLKMVDEIIAKYGYTPHLAARNLNKTSTKTIGILFPYFYSIFNHHYYVHILSGVADALINTEYQFKILLSRENSPKWDRYDFKKGESIDALLITQWLIFFSDRSALEDLRCPAMVLSDYAKGIKANFVCGDQFEGGQKAAEYLYKLGHRKFAVLTGSTGSVDGEARFKGFMHYLNSRNLTLDESWMIQADYREDFAYDRIERVLTQQGRRPTAIFCLNDRMAFGVLRRLKELNIKCPQEISVMGFDNDEAGKESTPPLTTVHVPLYEIAQEAVRQLLLVLKSPARHKPRNILFSSQLISRSSCASPLKIK